MADSISKSFNPNKHLKEEFVSNLNGSSMLEISWSYQRFLLWFFCDIASALIPGQEMEGYIATLTLDFIFIFLPTILFFTVLAEWAYIGIVFLATLLILSIAAKRNGAPSHLDGGPLTLRESITSYRVIVLGSYLFYGSHQPATFKTIKWAKIRVAILSLLFWSVTVVLDKYVERVSRRTCNLAYITWILGQHLQELAILMVCEYIPGYKTSALEDSLNRNMLATFLLANVLTGAVNLSMDTLSASSFTALSILVAYAYVLSMTIGFTDLCKLRLKFW